MALEDSGCSAVGTDETSMTLAQMRTLLRAMVGNPTVGNVSNSALDEVINLAYKDIVAKYRFHRARTICYVTTSAGQARYNLPQDVLMLKRVWNHDTEDEIVRRDMRLIIESTRTGRPKYYARIGKMIDLRPIPSDAWQIDLYYHRIIVSLSADGDVPVIPSVWHIGIVYYAAYFYWKIRQDHAKSQIAFNDWKVWVADKPSEYDEELRTMDVGTQAPQRIRFRQRRLVTVTDEEW